MLQQTILNLVLLIQVRAYWIQSHSPTFESVPVSRMYILKVADCTFTTLIAEPAILPTYSKLWKSAVELDSYRWSMLWLLKELHISLTFPLPIFIDILFIQSLYSIKQKQNKQTKTTIVFHVLYANLRKQWW